MTRSFSKTRPTMFAVVALWCVTAAQSLPAADTGTTTPNVTYTANGTFAATPIAGTDSVRLAGNPFTLHVQANESLLPTSGGATWAEYTGLAMKVTVVSSTHAEPLTFQNRRASVTLAVGNPDYDVFAVFAPISLGGLVLTFHAEAHLPKGTLTSNQILPLTAPYTVSAGNPATFVLACPFTQSINQYCNTSPLPSTTLDIASGTLSTSVQ
jgi:hypothetical protein